MRVWAVANQKGGVGKTTTAVTLGGLLAQQGRRVLLLDLDPHGSMTSYFRLDPDNLQRSSFDLFSPTPLDESALQQLLVETGTPGLTLMPASIALATVERKATAEGMGLRVAQGLARLWDQFDYVLIDTPPVLGALLINALAASEKLLVPVQTEFLALKGLERMMRTILMVTRSLKKEVDYTVIPTMFDRRTHASVTTLRSLRNDFPEHTWPSMIPVDTRFRDASKAAVIPSQFDPDSRGVAAYKALLKTLLSQQEQRLRA